MPTSSVSSPVLARSVRSAVIATGMLLAISLALRLATNVSALPPVWDEPIMQPIIERLAVDGWSVEHAIDYEDTKGPVFFWLYAAPATVLDADVDTLRWISIVLFILGGIPLGLLSAAAGFRLSQTAACVALYALLPYGSVLGQLFMSEPSFVLGALWMLVVFAWGVDAPRGTTARWAAPVVFGVLLALLLHHRPHIVAGAGAMVLVATARRGVASWPWWVAAMAAAIVRLPLYLRWGGLVTESYQHRLGLGIRAESLTYLLMTMLPCTLVLLWPVVRARRGAPRRSAMTWISAGAVVGLGLGVFAAPDMSALTSDGRRIYLGMVATTFLALPATIKTLAALALPALAGAALAATAQMSWRAARDDRSLASTIVAVAGATLVCGWLMYGFTRGQVFDRYLLPFVVFLPFAWVLRLPAWLWIVQAVGLSALFIRLAGSWLM